MKNNLNKIINFIKKIFFKKLNKSKPIVIDWEEVKKCRAIWEKESEASMLEYFKRKREQK